MCNGAQLSLTSCFNDRGIKMQALCHGICVTTSFAYIVIPVISFIEMPTRTFYFHPKPVMQCFWHFLKECQILVPLFQSRGDSHSLPTQDCFPIIIHFLQYDHMAHIELTDTKMLCQFNDKFPNNLYIGWDPNMMSLFINIVIKNMAQLGLWLG